MKARRTCWWRPLSPGTEAGKMPGYPGIKSHSVRLTKLCVAEEVSVNLNPAQLGSKLVQIPSTKSTHNEQTCH